MARETREEIVDLRHRRRAQTGAGLSLRVGGENAALHHDIFARGQANALLLLIAHEGQVGVEQVVRVLAPPFVRQPHDVDQHFREGIAGHRAIDAAFHFEVEEQAAVAG